MRSLAILLPLLLLVGCATAPRDMRVVWTQSAVPPLDLPAPQGFSVTPSQAFQIARESDMISLKPVWHLYADSHYYYVDDAFAGSSASAAYRRALRIDGRTGQIVPRP